MASVGAITFLRIDRAESKPGQIAENVTRPGVNGVALRKRGLRGRQFQLLCVRDFVNEAAFQTAYDTLRGYQATVQTWVNNEGTTYTDRLGIASVRVTRKRPMLSAVGGIEGTSGTIIATFAIEGVDTEVS